VTDTPRQLVVGIVLFPGVEVLDFAGPYEVFSMAGMSDTHRYCQAITIGIDRTDPAKREVHCTGGLRVIADHTAADCPPLDILIVPGGPGARNQVDQARLLEFLRARAKPPTVVASVCTGTFLLARAGLLEGKRVTTHPARIPQLAAEHPGVEVVREKIVDYGPLLTAGGVTSGIDLALYLLQRFFGKEARTREARRLDGPWT
jgi:transcriptional regulator GlxA family with amidase domain